MRWRSSWGTIAGSGPRTGACGRRTANSNTALVTLNKSAHLALIPRLSGDFSLPET